MSYKPKTLVVVEGGTGLQTLTTAYGVVCAGTSATGNLQNAGAGTINQVLTSNGAALPSYQDKIVGSRVLISSQTVSGSSGVVFTSGIASSGYSYFYIEGYEIVAGTSTATVLLVFSTDGGTNYSASTYTNAGLRGLNGGVSSTGTVTTGVFVAGPLSNSSTNTASFICNLYSLTSSSLSKNALITANWEWSSATGKSAFSQNAARWDTATAVNALKVYPDSGTISGTFRLFGVV